MKFNPTQHLVLMAHVLRRGIEQGSTAPRRVTSDVVSGPPEGGIQPVDAVGTVTWLNLAIVEVNAP